MLEVALPLLCEIVHLAEGRSNTVISLVRGDFEAHLEPAFPQRPALTTIDRLAVASNCSRGMLYGDWLAEAIEDCAVAFTMLLAARGDFLEHTVWRMCELDSPVGRSAKGPGIPDGQHVQRLFGPMLGGPDMHLPALLAPPPENLDSAALARQIGSMLARTDGIAEKVRNYAKTAVPDKLREFELTVDELRAYRPSQTILVPKLAIGPPLPAGWLGALSPDTAVFVREMESLSFQRAVLEVDDDPYAGPEPVAWIDRRLLRRLLGWAFTTALDIEVRPAEVSYCIVERDGFHILHRRQHEDNRRGPETVRAVAMEMSFALLGFNLDAAYGSRFDPELALAIAYAEFLATSTHPMECGQRFVEHFAPSLVKARDDASRAFVRALRMISNTALVAVARQRQADELAA